MGYIGVEVWRTFRFPLLVGLTFGIGFFYVSTKHLNIYDYLSSTDTLLVSLIIGCWMFCVPFGFRTIEHIISKIVKGTWVVSLIIYIPWWIIKFSIAIQFAPIFFLIHIVALLYRLIKYKDHFLYAHLLKS